MADLKYYNYPGIGEALTKMMSYSQAVRVGDTIQCSGQGGWDPEKETIVLPSDVQEQIDQAFRNVDLALRAASASADSGKEKGKGKVVGWPQVFRVNSYHVPLDGEALGAMARNFRRWCPDHQPIWTAVGVAQLGDENMKVEIEVQAYDPQPQGAKKDEA